MSHLYWFGVRSLQVMFDLYFGCLHDPTWCFYVLTDRSLVSDVIVVAVGLQTVNSSAEWDWSDIFPVTGDGWKKGGEWEPEHCTARYHMAVIIPSRDRDSNLKALLRHLIPILRRQLIHFRIFVVEQAIITKLLLLLPTCPVNLLIIN